MSAPTPTILPIITIQPSFLDVISEVFQGVIPSERFWISCYKTSHPSVHGKINAELDERDRNLVNLRTVDEDVKIVQDKDTISMDDTYNVSCPSLSIPQTRIVTPKRVFADPERAHPQHPHRITAFDVSPDTTQIATGYLDGSVYLTSTNHSAPTSSTYEPAKGKPHLSTVTTLQFFPSSKVLLSGGLDFSLTILPANLDTAPSSGILKPVRVLRGHTRGITGTGIVGKGKNVLSASGDGTVKLWNVSGGEVVRSWGFGVGVNDINLGERREGGVAGELMAQDSREVETRDKIVWGALQDGTFTSLDLRVEKPVFRSPLSGTPPLKSITYAAEENLLATGSNKGLVSVYDTRSRHTPLTSFQRNTSSIESLAFLSNRRLVCGTEDGSPFIAALGSWGEATTVAGELVGSDCDAVRVVRVAGQGVWSAGDDGVVREYRNM